MYSTKPSFLDKFIPGISKVKETDNIRKELNNNAHTQNLTNKKRWGTTVPLQLYPSGTFHQHITG